MKKLTLGFVAAASLFGCGQMQSTDPDLTCATSPQAATLATNVQAVFDDKCKSCHVANYSYGDYTSATATAAIVNKKSLYAGSTGSLLIVDGTNKSLANSSLWLKVLGGATKGRTGPHGENVYGAMPNDGTTLSAAQQQLLKDWICTGAK